MDYASYPAGVAQDIARLRRRIRHSGIPPRTTDSNLILGTWNIKAFGPIHPSWEEAQEAPKRTYHSLAILAEIVRCYDILAIQEVKRDLTALRCLLDWLGSDWGVIMTDVTAGEAGNAERLAFLFDQRRVQASGLAGEIVLPPLAAGAPASQFARTPYAVGFQAGAQRFVLVTAHILYGREPREREPEIRALAEYTAREMRDRARQTRSEDANLILLGDFNIDKRQGDPLFDAFTSTGLVVPEPLRSLPTVPGSQPKFYDQIAWFMGTFDIPFLSAGVINFAGAVCPELPLRQTVFRVSDHLPLWASFRIDRSEEAMAVTLGLDPAMPNPLDTVPDTPA
jgi:endonuclease/exonuclease/phosphatase family metal-dependent hydrolase